MQSFLPVPLSWLYLLPAEANNSAGALHALAQLTTAERLPSLLFTAETSIEVINALHAITLRQYWTSAEQEVLRAFLLRRGIFPRPITWITMCEAWFDLTAAYFALLIDRAANPIRAYPAAAFSPANRHPPPQRAAPGWAG